MNKYYPNDEKPNPDYILHIKLYKVKDKPGTIVAQLQEFPFIIVKSDNIEDIVKKVGIHLEIYFKTFPIGKSSIWRQQREELSQQEHDD